jgi:protein CpxP
MKTKKISAILLATTLSFAGISYAMAGNHQESKNGQDCNNQSGEMKQGRHNCKIKHQRMGFSKLDLSDAQKQQMQEIMSAAKEENKGTRGAHKAEMQMLMSSETFDEAKAKELINNQQVQKAEKHLKMMKAKHQMFQLLTDEQKTQYSELKSQRHNR